MTLFRILLVVLFAVITSYTVLAIAEQGLNLLPTIVGSLQQPDWQAQFNVDFFTFLIVVGLWIAWRHNFTPAGILLGLCITGGMIFLSAYLLILSYQADGDVKKMLLGDRA